MANKNIIPRFKTIDTSDDATSASFLPRHYRSDANKKLLHSTINQLTQPGRVKKVSGYIGRPYSKSTTDEVFVEAPTRTRQNYQLEPGFIIDDTLDNTVFLKDYQDYINQLRVFGANVSNHSRLNLQEFYSWNPHINWDMIVNFQNYYWMPHGPDTVTIRNSAKAVVISTYNVTIETTEFNSTYVFSPDGLTKNPVITLYRGQTYKFQIDSPGHTFSIKTLRTAGVANRYITNTLVNNSIQSGEIVFTVPSNAPSELVYVSENNIDMGGIFNILDLTDSGYINVDAEIIGKKTYKFNNVELSNGMKVQFAGQVFPKTFSTGRYYVEGVGESIKLVKESDLEIITSYTSSKTMLFDNTLFDTTPFSDASSYVSDPDYIVINRASNDRNFWSRNNKWIHKDVIEKSALLNETYATYDQAFRAVRPIIEFEKNLKLFNFGTHAITDISLIDTYTRDAFSTVEGSLGYNIDGVTLSAGQRVIFTAETDVLVKNNIYEVEFVDVLHDISTRKISQTGTIEQVTAVNSGWTAVITGLDSVLGLVLGTNLIATSGTGKLYSGSTSPDLIKVTAILSSSSVQYTIVGGAKPIAGTVTNISTTLDSSRQIRLVEVSKPMYNQVALVKEGVTSQGQMYWYDGETWNLCQHKTKANQPPLFDVVDSNLISFGNTSSYPGTTFKGTSVFSYKVGSGTVDSNLGFALSYKNINNIGDIVFNFSLITDTFKYELAENTITKSIDTGLLVTTDDTGNTKYVNGWETSSIQNPQAAIRLYKDSNLTNNFDIDIFNSLPSLDDIEVRVYVNNVRVNSALWTLRAIAGRYYTVHFLTESEITDHTLTPVTVALTDTVMIKTYSMLPINTNGFFEIPINLQNNPLNGVLSEFTLGEVIDHVDSIVDNIFSLGFLGVYPGISNLRDMGPVSQYGTKFIQHSGPSSLSAYHITSDTNNVIRAIDQSRDDYCTFKKSFLTIATTLGVDADPFVHVNMILQELFKNVPKTACYYFSDMLPYNSKTQVDFTVQDPEDNIFSLSEVFDLTSLSNKAVNVYLNDVQLLHGTQYEFNDRGFVLVSAPLLTGDTLTVIEYDSTDGCLIPETPTKLGLWPKYEPKKYLDTSLVVPMNMIQGHDGSLTLAYNDYRDELLLELEKRIYNNIKVEYNPAIFDLTDYLPSYSRKTNYSLKEFNDILMPNFNNWAANAGIDFSTVLSYDKTNSFTFNYANHTAPDGRVVPAYWRGIYNWMLDTDRPHLCPWEMLGFSEEPAWWSEVYGPAPYTKDNLILWDDISKGLVKEPSKPVVRLKKYVKPFLLDHIPVDDQGNLISPMYSGLATGQVVRSLQGDFSFGDGSPIETAWRRSSHYAFSALKSAILMYPAKTIGTLFDRSQLVRNQANQLVYLDTSVRVTPATVKLPSVYLSSSRVQTAGLVNYIVNSINCESLTFYNQYKTELQTITAKLCYRVSAFTSKEKFNLLLDSKSPTSTGSIFIPQEDYKIVLNTSSPITILTYSGVIITKVVGGFEIKGYSRLTPFFKYYTPANSTGNDVNVGGISESFMEWAYGSRYVVGNVVSYQGIFYRVLSDHIATEVSTVYYEKLVSLPVVGGVNVRFKTGWSTVSKSMQYGTKISSVQEVVDFLLGYGSWLSDQGFVFNEFSSELETVSNWETSAKEFIFWTTQNWTAPSVTWTEWVPGISVSYGEIIRYNGEFYKSLITSTINTFDEDNFFLLNGVDLTGNSVISISPAANKLVFNTVLSIVDDISNPYNVYEMFDANGKPILTHFLNTFRVDNAVSYSPRNNAGIYCASFYLIQREHVVVINNTTMFNDTIYNLESGYKQDKIKVSGYVSIDWNGSLSVPGFVVDQARVVDWTPWQPYAVGDLVKHKSFYYSSNLSTKGEETFNNTQWIKLDKKPTSKLLPNWNYKAGQFTDFYSLDSENFDSAQQQMAQHLVGYQKRQYLENIIQDDVSEYKFYQGMIIEKGTQNVLNKLFDVLSADNKESLNFYEEWAVRVGQYGACSAFENIEFTLPEQLFNVNPQSFELVTERTSDSNIVIQQTAADIYLKPNGYTPNVWPAAKNVKTATMYARLDEVNLTFKTIDDFLTLEDISTINYGDYVLCTFAPIDWNIYQYVSRSFIITDITSDAVTVTFTLEDIKDITVGSLITIDDLTTIVIYEVSEVNDNNISISSTKSFVLDEAIINGMFISRRIKKSIDNNNYKIDDINPGMLLWTDNDTNDTDFYDDTSNWKVWEYNPIYTRNIKLNENLKITEYGRSIASSDNGKVLAISAVTTENLVAEGSVMIYNNTVLQGWILSQVITNPFRHSTVSVYRKSDVASVVAMSNDGIWIAIGSPTVDLNRQGAISIYKKDPSNVYSMWSTIVSPVPTNNEQFGKSLTFGNDILFVGTDIGKLYKITYTLVDRASAVYISAGSAGTNVQLTTVDNIEVDMIVSGKGFTDGQVVSYINETESTIAVSFEPSEKPAGIITFSSYEWVVYEVALEGPTQSLQFGMSVAVSKNNTLVVSEPYNEILVGGNNIIVPGAVYVYSSSDDYTIPEVIEAPSDSKIFGKSVAISKNDNFIAISTLIDNASYEGKVEIYKFNEYTSSIQTLSSPAISVSGEFGSNLHFINDYSTLIIGHAISPLLIKNATFYDDINGVRTETKFSTFINSIYSSAIDVFDMYNLIWIFSERLAPPLPVINNTTFGAAVVVTPNSVIVSAPKSNANAGVVYEYIKPPLTYTWKVKNTVIAKPDITKIKQAFLYNKRTNKLVKYLDVVDPIQNKHATIAEREVKYKFAYDPAVYTVGTSSVNVDDGVAWASEQVGSLWWDLRTTKFVDNFTDNIIYRNSMLSTLAYAASVDIYEWVAYKDKPASWDAIADTDAGLALNISGKSLYGNSVYTAVKRYDTLSQTFKYTYYFWVKNKEVAIPGRSISAANVSRLISNPKGEGYEYLALTGLNSFSLVNVKPLLSHNDVVLSVEYWTVDKTDQNIHTEWKLISAASTTTLPESIETKWIDSLCGKDLGNRLVPDQSLPMKLRFGIENRPRQSMFVNRFEALKQVIEQTNLVLKENLITDTRSLENLKKYDTPPNVLHRLYDTTFNTDLELRFAITKYFKLPVLSPVIEDGKILEVIIEEPGRGYLVAPTIEIYGVGSSASLKTTIDETGQIASVVVENSGYGYTDSTTLIVRNFAVLILSDSTSNGKWSIYSYVPSTSSWYKSLSYSYDVTKYWHYTDWYATGYNQFTSIQHSVNTYADLYQLNDKVGDRVKVRVTTSGRWVLLEKYAASTSIDWTLSYNVIGSENGTVQFSSLLYNFKDTAVGFDGSIYDASVYDNYAEAELRIILNAIKDDLLIDDLKDDYLKLFFTSIRYAMSEQTYIDWIFKTSFVNVMHNVGELRQEVTYKNDNLSNFEDYVSEVKPYRTQVREYISSYDVLENSNTSVSDFDLPAAYDSVTKTINAVDTNNPLINTYPWKNWFDNVGYSIVDIKITDSGSEYISEPIIKIVSETGNGATAKAFIVNKQIARIRLISGGSGYTTTPEIEIVGGYNSSGTAARAVAILGNSVIRTSNLKLKFDRIYQDFVIDDLQFSEQIENVTGTKVQFVLKWMPDLTIGKTTVTINELAEIRDNYTMGTVSTIVNGHPVYTGVITFKTAPSKNSIIIVNYYKNTEMLNATDRIQYYYQPLAGELGKDIPQLMSGVDYGGVTVGGLNFDIVHGWDSVPYHSDTWDNFNPDINDISITVGNEFSYDIKMPYIPSNGTRYNVYYVAVGMESIRLDAPDYEVGVINAINPNAIMSTPVASGDTDVIEIPSSVNASAGDTFIIRKETSDGSVVNDYDTILSGGAFTRGSAAGLAAEDIIVDGDEFYSTVNGYGPEEVVPGQVVDTLAIKVYTKSATGAFMQFKNMLNTVTYSRLNNNKKTKLAKDLLQTDTTITVLNSSGFDGANQIANNPGIIYINGERIEYFTNQNNVLGNLRRGTMGTGVPSVHKAQSVVQEISLNEKLSYSDTVRMDQFVASGSNIVTLSYAPKKSSSSWSFASGFTSTLPSEYGQTDEVEVFVGGYDDNAVWISGINYELNDIVNVGVYIYRCIVAHTSSTEFKDDRFRWTYFIGNIRLKKAPFTVHNMNVNPNSPAGDVQFDADFSVNGTSKQIRLTHPVTPGTLITVIRKTGVYWELGSAPVIAFINAVPASEYEPPVI
jgi:hypothetical protein